MTNAIPGWQREMEKETREVTHRMPLLSRRFSVSIQLPMFSALFFGVFGAHRWPLPELVSGNYSAANGSSLQARRGKTHFAYAAPVLARLYY